MGEKFKKMDITRYSVGEKYDKVMHRDGAVFETYQDMCFCSIGLSNASSREIRAVSEDCISVDLCETDGIIFVCISIGNVLSFDMPFNMCLYKEFSLKEPKGGGYLMPIILVENRTNIIKAIRVIGFDAMFSKKLYELSQNQWENGMADYDKKLAEVFLKYPTYALVDKSIACNKFGGNRI